MELMYAKSQLCAQFVKYFAPKLGPVEGFEAACEATNEVISILEKGVKNLKSFFVS